MDAIYCDPSEHKKYKGGSPVIAGESSLFIYLHIFVLFVVKYGLFHNLHIFFYIISILYEIDFYRWQTL